MPKKILIVIVVIVVLIVIFMATGALKFNLGVSKGDEANKPAEFVLPEGWAKYTSGEFGYSVAYPDGWNVQEKNTGQREVLLIAPKNLAFVRISAFKDESLSSPEKVEASIAEYKASFAGKQSERLKEFKSEMQGGVGGFMAAGKMDVNGLIFQFLEKGLLSSNGRVLIMRGAVDTTEANMVQEEFDAYVKTVRQIMDSFKVN